MMKRYQKILVLVLFIGITISLNAKVTLPAIYSDHMVLQQQSEVKLWGWGKPMEKITVNTTWDSDSLKTEVDNQCNWSVVLKTPKAGGPFKITIQGYTQIQLSDVMIGEVWLLSGQSNMEWNFRLGFNNSEEELKEANHPNIRLFSVTHRTSTTPNHDVFGNWEACTSESAIDFSAIGYFFGRTLNDTLNVPIGLINTAWGGSAIETWIPEEIISSNSELLEAAKAIHEMRWAPREPGRIYNAMIAPIMPYEIAGALWYQGETNTSNAKAYTAMLSEMTNSWRAGFKNDFPFFYAQIAPWKNYGSNAGAMVREAQRRALETIENSAMIVVSDFGDTLNIHPRNKKEAGLRFANLALNKVYGRTQIPINGPVYMGYEIQNKKIIVQFDYAEGLHADGNALDLFEVKDTKGNWHVAKAKIMKNTIEVSCKEVSDPQGVRFAWSNTATPKLFNKYKLPASCFTSTEDME